MVEGLISLQSRIDELAAENEQIKQILAMGAILYKERNLEKLLPLMMTEISKILDAERSTLFLVDWESGQLWTKFAEGLESNRIHIGLKMGLVGLCILAKKIVNVAYAYDSPYFNSDIDAQTGYYTESVLCAPVYNQKREIIGALEFLNKKSGVFTGEDEENLSGFTEGISAFDYSHMPDLERIKAASIAFRDELKCERCALFILNHENGELRSVFADAIDGWDIVLKMNMGVAGLVALTAEEVNIPDAYKDFRFDKSVDEQTGYKTRCMLCIPLKALSGEIFGVIEVMNKRKDVFTAADMDLLKSLSTYLSMFLENAILFKEQTNQFRSVLEVLAASIDAKDSLTAGHSSRVAQYTVGIAKELGFKEDDIDTLNVAALLHDYGKLGTDDRILKKPGRLTPEEYEHIKEHVANTRNILNKMTFSRKYRNVPLLASSHHERLDGSGYEGMTGTKIPFMARIIAVADVFEAMTAKRHYRDPIPAAEAFQLLDEGVGSKYDGNIVRALKSHFKKSNSAG
jgi:HD-GYP domain-containing protein (c-di-GMP phosphodiesterase class II)